MKGWCKLDSKKRRRGKVSHQWSVILGTPGLTSPLCPVTMLHLSGRCHCVFCGCRQWRGPCVPCSHGRGMAPHSPRHCTICLLSPARLSALEFSPSPPYRTLLPLVFFLLVGTSLARLLGERTPSPPFSFSPLDLAQGAHLGDVVPHLMSHW
jgi:hypothetical protein